MSGMSDFERASAVERVGDGLYRADIPDGWQQGRGAFGGLVLATLLRAIEASEPDRGRATRTLSGDLCGPVEPGPVELRVRVLRRGNNQSNLAAELWQRGEVQATASAVLSAARKATLPSPKLHPPAPATMSGTPALPFESGRPTFAAHYEHRTLLPFTALPEPVCEGWIRERTPLSRVDAPAMIGRLDAWWPTAFSISPDRRPTATISFTAELLADPTAIDPSQPLRYRARMAAFHEGFFVELRELWLGERPVALNQQTFVLIK